MSNFDKRWIYVRIILAPGSPEQWGVKHLTAATRDEAIERGRRRFNTQRNQPVTTLPAGIFDNAVEVL